jgi:putative chitinase
MLTKDQLSKMIKGNKYLDNWYDALKLLLPEYDINTNQRIAAFMAQSAHESGGYTAFEENLKYSAAGLRRTFAKYFTTDELARDYASRSNRQEAIANRVYANRYGNGNEASGDGWRYRGRGIFQLTFHDNYKAFGESLDPTLTPQETSEYMATFEGAVQSACWFWETKNLNKYADKGDLKGMTRVINGGYNGLEDRIKHNAEYLHILGG